MISDTDLTPTRSTKFNLARFARKNALQIGIVVVFLAIWIVFIVAASDTFLSPDIYAAFMATVPVFGIIALPLTMVTIAV
jgi:ribose/xylose/arabinose/galactoside ABC-type transport system permease subunit